MFSNSQQMQKQLLVKAVDVELMHGIENKQYRD